MHRTFRALLLTTASLTFTSAALAEDAANRYTQTNYVANASKYAPSFDRESDMVNAWGIAIRPAGAGGHFWVTAKNKSHQYVGDVTASPDEKLRGLVQDRLATIDLPVGSDEAFATGTTFNGSKKDFIITQKVDGAEDITAPAKFMFASDGGVISAWTERKKTDGSFDWPMEAISVIDQSKEGAQFFGLTTNADYSKLYVADFGAAPAIKVFDGQFKPAKVTFANPFDSNKNGKVDAGEYAPFNVQYLKTPAGADHIFVAYAKTQPCPEEEIKKDTCKAGELFVGEEDTSKPGQGRVAEFTDAGKLVAVWKDGGKLSAPWGLTFAPKDFGAISGSLLVGNFGDGTIAAYDAKTHKFKDYLRDDKGQIVKIDGLWGLLFGNGASLGDANALYFAAGPDEEKDGIFGSLRPAK
jgi:uncharacterized protein (TIGR03118 family)